MTTTNNKLNLRTCPLPALCEWILVNIMERKPPSAPDKFGLQFSLDAVAAVEAKAREGRLKFANFRHHYSEMARPAFRFQTTIAWVIELPDRKVKSGTEYSEASTEPEARLRAVALAFEAAKEGR